MTAPSSRDTGVPDIDPSAFSTTRFDYLIVGGGTAALVIASRLSAIPTITVGVVEAGPKSLNDPLITVPGRCGEAIGSQYDWQFETTPQPMLNGRSLPWPRGRVIGGTSALNFMVWMRGNRKDYDAWEELGNTGWGWEGMLPYFKKTETLHQSTPEHQLQHQSYYTVEDHGAYGPIASVYSKEYGVPHKNWHATLNNLGLATNKSHFAGSNLGAFTTLVSVDPTTRQRASSATAYYTPNAERGNLHVLTNAIVEKIDLEEKDGQWTATGVTYSCGGEKFSAKASHEVIIGAGSIQSPQLLELSGIGDPNVLNAAGIAVKVANPNVGENLQDHPMTTMIFEIDSSLVGPNEVRANPELKKAAQEAYDTSQSGPYASLPYTLAYAPLTYIVPSSMHEKIVMKLPKTHTSRDEVLAKQFADPKRGQIEYIFDVGMWSPYFKPETGKVYGTLLMMLQLPLSKGKIHISSPSVHDKPLINPQYFEGTGGEIDLTIMEQAQHFAAKIGRTAPLSNLIRKRVFPPDTEGGDQDFTPWIRETLVSDWHPVGTCGMGGHAGIKGGVVDERLRVYGVKGLRVADASIMPLHICSHPQATIYAIGEKAADMILEDRQGE